MFLTMLISTSMFLSTLFIPPIMTNDRWNYEIMNFFGKGFFEHLSIILFENDLGWGWGGISSTSQPV